MNLLAIVIALTTAGAGGPAELDRIFQGTEAAFVVCGREESSCVRYNAERCRRRFSPFSTFKIPNSLIGLETGAVADVDTVIAWDRVKYPPFGEDTQPFASWWRDHSLESAFRNSVVWYYRELAKRVGKEKMARLVTAIHYGNEDASGGEAFWLDGGSLRISADEQIQFLRAFHAGKLPVSSRYTAIVKRIMIREKTPAFTLSGKTGGGSIPGGRSLGWFVGYLGRGDDVHFFATNIEGADYLEIRDRRIDLTMRALRALGYLP